MAMSARVEGREDRCYSDVFLVDLRKAEWCKEYKLAAC